MILFAYDFPHKKTMDFIFYSNFYGHKIDAVIAAPFVKLNTPKRILNTSINYRGLIDTKDMCERYDIPFHSVPHNSDESVKLLEQYSPTLGLISGARILSKRVINCFKKGIINFHPGLIPDCRGLDTTQWVFYDNLKVGVTSHFIDPRVDAGWIIKKKEFERTQNDNLRDISLTLYQGQLEIFEETLKLAKEKELESLEFIPHNSKPSYGYFPTELDLDLKSYWSRM